MLNGRTKSDQFGFIFLIRTIAELFVFGQLCLRLRRFTGLIAELFGEVAIPFAAVVFLVALLTQFLFDISAVPLEMQPYNCF